MSQRQLGWITVVGWGVFAVYNVLFQWLAVGLNPKILNEKGVNVEAVQETFAWKAREFLMPLWLNNGYVWSALSILALLTTLTWLYSRRRSRQIETGWRLVI